MNKWRRHILIITIILMIRLTKYQRNLSLSSCLMWTFCVCFHVADFCTCQSQLLMFSELKWQTQILQHFQLAKSFNLQLEEHGNEKHPIRRITVQMQVHSWVKTSKLSFQMCICTGTILQKLYHPAFHGQKSRCIWKVNCSLWNLE